MHVYIRVVVCWDVGLAWGTGVGSMFTARIKTFV